MPNLLERLSKSKPSSDDDSYIDGVSHRLKKQMKKQMKKARSKSPNDDDSVSGDKSHRLEKQGKKVKTKSPSEDPSIKLPKRRNPKHLYAKLRKLRREALHFKKTNERF